MKIALAAVMLGKDEENVAGAVLIQITEIVDRSISRFVSVAATSTTWTVSVGKKSALLTFWWVAEEAD